MLLIYFFQNDVFILSIKDHYLLKADYNRFVQWRIFPTFVFSMRNEVNNSMQRKFWFAFDFSLAKPFVVDVAICCGYV